MVGQMVERLLSKSDGIDVKHTYRGQDSTSFHFDAEDGLDGLHKVMERHGTFDYFINCIGILNNKIDKKDSRSVRRAILVNALFPHELAALAHETGARVIHISTDGVFARDAGVCMENSPQEYDDVYGKAKSLGEVIAPGFLNLRCSIIGPNSFKKQGLFEWFHNQPHGAEVCGYTDHLWNGVTTLQFAKLCRELILQDFFDVVSDESPVHHFCPNQAVSKYELLQLFKAACRPDITVKPVADQGKPISRILDTRYNSLRDLFDYGQPMQYAINELTTEIKEKKNESNDHLWNQTRNDKNVVGIKKVRYP